MKTMPDKVYNQLNAIRVSGIINMFDFIGVCNLLDHEGSDWIQENKDQYFEGLLHGPSVWGIKDQDPG